MTLPGLYAELLAEAKETVLVGDPRDTFERDLATVVPDPNCPEVRAARAEVAKFNGGRASVIVSRRLLGQYRQDVAPLADPSARYFRVWPDDTVAPVDSETGRGRNLQLSRPWPRVDALPARFAEDDQTAPGAIDDTETGAAGLRSGRCDGSNAAAASNAPTA
ncbi:hypothetical protein [Mycolicibacterium fluoranthenivorans]|uniref:hypothetical protein n=1 Tax=Mycolicibacterium fluoranthenivorans TaxID=258505 RepID=UPI0011141017|nr:hypothetical protein [Mycolicibacterium fluoranthenivorans]